MRAVKSITRREHRLRCSRLCYTLFSCSACCFAFHSAYSRCPSSLSKNACISGSRTRARASTVRIFQVRDLDLENRVLFTRHIKNNRPQPLPLCSDMVAILQEYLTYREGKANEPLFPSDADKPMTENGLRCSIADDNRRRGGKKDFHPPFSTHLCPQVSCRLRRQCVHTPKAVRPLYA